MDSLDHPTDPPNNSMEPPPLRFAPLAPCRGRSTLRAGDLRPIPASQAFGFGAILALARRAAPPQVCSANLETVRRNPQAWTIPHFNDIPLS